MWGSAVFRLNGSGLGVRNRFKSRIGGEKIWDASCRASELGVAANRLAGDSSDSNLLPVCAIG